MFRLLGFVIGSAVSVITILLIVGIPEFHLANPDLEKRRFDEAIEKLREKKQGAELVVDGLVADLASGQPQSDATPPADARTGGDRESADQQPSSEQSAPPAEESQPISDDQALPMAPSSPPASAALPILEDSQWHAFWNPFRSEIAAKGFVTQLEKVTGLDYRIVKVDAGVYQVAFAYASDSERRSKLSQISAATGLEFPDS
jgi:hypothetical protein